jgi:hypothetical protein
MKYFHNAAISMPKIWISKGLGDGDLTLFDVLWPSQSLRIVVVPYE